MEDDYLLRRRPLYALAVFALPILLGNFFQQTYTLADSAIVGRFVSQQALAAVGALLCPDQYFYLRGHRRRHWRFGGRKPPLWCWGI